jgi:hypothetical protein
MSSSSSSFEPQWNFISSRTKTINWLQKKEEILKKQKPIH